MELNDALAACLAAARPDSRAMSSFVKSHVHARLVGNITQGGIALASVVLTLMASILRTRPLSLLHGLIALLVLVLLLRALTPKTIRVERFFGLCYFFLFYLLLRATTYLFGVSSFAFGAAWLYDLAVLATVVTSAVSPASESVSAFLFYALFLIPRPGVSPYVESVLVSTTRTCVLYAMFFTLQFAARDSVVRHPNNAQLDDVVAMPRFLWVLLVHPVAWLFAPLVVVLTAVTVERVQVAGDTEAPPSPSPPPPPVAPVPAPQIVAPVPMMPPPPASTTAPRYKIVGVNALPSNILPPAPAPYLTRPTPHVSDEEAAWLARQGLTNASFKDISRRPV